jgi:hypothetical protein
MLCISLYIPWTMFSIIPRIIPRTRIMNINPGPSGPQFCSFLPGVSVGGGGGGPCMVHGFLLSLLVLCTNNHEVSALCFVLSFWNRQPVERLYCKRPIQCLASFEILTPPSPHRPASVYPPAFGAGGGHTHWVERGWGVNSSEEARHCSVHCVLAQPKG